MARGSGRRRAPQPSCATCGCSGSRPPDELEGLYRVAGGVVLTSLYEGFGLPVLEAMVRGVAVACSDIPALREVSGNAALRFPPTDADAVASAIERMLYDETTARELRAAGLRQAMRFSWARAAKATLGCYRRALAGAGARER